MLWQLLTDLSNAEGPVAAYTALPEEAQQAVMWPSESTGVTTEAVITQDVMQSDAIACRRHIRTLVRRGAFGWHIATFKSDTWWCRKNGKIHGQPSVHWSGQIHHPYRFTREYAGLAYLM